MSSYNIITKNEIEFFLSSQKIRYNIVAKDFVVGFPVSISNYNNAGLSFYSGNDYSYIKDFKDTKKGLIICSNKLSDIKVGPFLLVDDPKYIFVLIASLFQKKEKAVIDKTSILSKKAIIGINVSIGCNTVIGDDVIIEDNVIIGNNCVIENSIIKKNTIIMHSSLIGSSGLGSIFNKNGNQIPFPHFGKVEIFDNCILGNNTIINRGSLSNTIIKKNTHISANCFIAHNCIIGENVFMAPYVKIAGSSVIGDNCFIGMDVNIKDNITIESNNTIGMGVSITKSIVDVNGTFIENKNLKRINKLFNLK